MSNPRNRLLIAMSTLTIFLLLASSIFAASFDAVEIERPSASWEVTVSRSNQFDNTSLLQAASATPTGLTVTLYSWEILDAVVTSDPVTPGSACPAPGNEAITGSTQTIVICGRNRTNTALTPTWDQSSLSGTFVQTPGTFSSGQIAGNSASSVVLANWTDTRITNDVGLHMTVIATIGSSSKQTSPSTVLADYAATNQSPTANPDNATTDEDSSDHRRLGQRRRPRERRSDRFEHRRHGDAGGCH